MNLYTLSRVNPIRLEHSFWSLTCHSSARFLQTLCQRQMMRNCTHPTPLTANWLLRYGSFQESSPISREKTSSMLVGAQRNSTARSLTSLEVCDKGKPGESRRRKATRLKRTVTRNASRAAEPHYTGGASCVLSSWQ
jgi:hypothetical protein